MKYTIYGYRQDVAFKLGLYFDELAILRYFDDFRNTGKMYTKEIDGKKYHWVIYEKIVEDYPVFKLKFKDPVRKVASMMKKGSLSKVLLSKTLHWNGLQRGTFSFFAINEDVYNELVSPILNKEVAPCKEEQLEVAPTMEELKNENYSYDIKRLIKKLEAEASDEEYGF